MGEFRLGYSTGCMVQGDVGAMIGSKPESFSGGQFGFAVETLDNAAGNLSFGTKPVEQEGAMPT